MSWDFSKLPEGSREEVEVMLERDDFRGMIKMHNDHGLSGWRYCCQRHFEGVRMYFEKGVRENLIP